MKILITLIKYPGVVGVSTYIEQLIKGLKNHGHHVDLFSHNPNIAGNKIGRKQSPLINYKAATSSLSFNQYDIIHSQGIIPTLAISQIKSIHPPLIMSLHGALTFNMLLNGVLKKSTPSWKHSLAEESQAISSSDICIVGSQWLKNIVLKEYRASENQEFSIIPYGIDIGDFEKKMQLPPATKAPGNKFVIVCTARLVPLKGHKFLLDALFKLKLKRQDWVCWLIGDGPSRITLQQYTQRLGLGRYIQFLGNQKNVAALLKEADIFVFPSLQDNLPYAVMEAQIAGVPVVATNTGGIPEMVKNGKTGLISPSRNSDSLYQNINLLMESSELRSALVTNAKNWAIENWAIEKMISSTIAVYQDALKIKN